MIRRVLTLVAGVGIAYVVVRQVRKRFGDNDADDFWDDFDEGEPVDPAPGRSVEPPMESAPPQPLMQQALAAPTATPERPLAVVGESGGSGIRTTAEHGPPAAGDDAASAAETMPRALTPDDAARFVESVSEAEGMIKGNIRHDGERIYHMPGDPAYERVHPEQRFATAAEAEAAGFRRAGRAHS